MNTLADLGHTDLADADELPDPEPTPAADDHAAHRRTYALADGRTVTVGCGGWCAPSPLDDPEHRPWLADAPPVYGVPAAGWSAVLDGPDRPARRVRTEAPAPEVAARPATDAETGQGPRDLLAAATAAGWAATATYARGPLPAERSRCGRCGTYARINADGSLARHGVEPAPCGGGELVEIDGAGKGACPACGRVVKRLKSGRAAKHATPAVKCDSTALDPDALAWQMADSVVVRATSPRGHRLTASWVAGSGDGAWLHLAGYRPVPVGLADLGAALRACACAGAAPERGATSSIDGPKPSGAGVRSRKAPNGARRASGGRTAAVAPESATARRILVTGSRRWADPAAVEAAIARAAAPGAVVIHGGAAGADLMADATARRLGLGIERHDADWSSPCAASCPPGHRKARQGGGDYCPAAGHRRNQAMVDLGADVVLAFVLPGSRGTADCMRRARAAGLPVVEVVPVADGAAGVEAVAIPRDERPELAPEPAA